MSKRGLGLRAFRGRWAKRPREIERERMTIGFKGRGGGGGRSRGQLKDDERLTRGGRGGGKPWAQSKACREEDQEDKKTPYGRRGLFGVRLAVPRRRL